MPAAQRHRTPSDGCDERRLHQCRRRKCARSTTRISAPSSIRQHLWHHPTCFGGAAPRYRPRVHQCPGTRDRAACRIGNAVSPDHYARGWHITATCGVLGAALGVELLNLDADQPCSRLAAPLRRLAWSRRWGSWRKASASAVRHAAPCYALWRRRTMTAQPHRSKASALRTSPARILSSERLPATSVPAGSSAQILNPILGIVINAVIDGC